MKESEFKEIIKPLSLLPFAQVEFLRKDLLGNFKKWKSENKTK